VNSVQIQDAILDQPRCHGNPKLHRAANVLWFGVPAEHPVFLALQRLTRFALRGQIAYDAASPIPNEA
jgi:hypothetical protein